MDRRTDFAALLALVFLGGLACVGRLVVCEDSGPGAANVAGIVISSAVPSIKRDRFIVSSGEEGGTLSNRAGLGPIAAIRRANGSNTM